MLDDNYFVKKYRDLLSLSPKLSRLFTFVLLPIGVYELIKIVPPILFKEIIDWMVVYDPSTGMTLNFILILLAGYLLSLVSMSFVEYLTYLSTDLKIRDAEVDIAKRTLKKLLRLDITYHERNNTGVSMNSLLKGQAKMNDLLWSMTGELLPVFFQTIFTLIVLFWLGFEIGIAFLFFIPMFVIIIKRGTQETQKAREEYYMYHDQFANLATQAVSNIRTVKDFASEKKEQRKTGRVLAKFSRAVAERSRKGRRNVFIQGILVSVARVTTLALAVWLMVRGFLTAGGLVLVMTLSEKAFSNLARLYRTYYRIQDAEPSIDRFKDIQDAHVDVKDKRGSRAKARSGKLGFRNVSFAYPGTNRDAVSDISFDVPDKSTLALVGRSGAGKSTLVKLLFRHADPNEGEIVLDDKPIREYALSELRSVMAIVSQDVELFNESILSNIAYGVERVGRKDVIRVAKMANAHEFIEELPQGYDTLVGERGVKLSGGQKQRVAIARALLCRPKVLVFDEATSSLDAESEKQIHEAIFALSGKLTLIMIAHRFSTIEHADKIVLLEDGRVEEVGTHEQLLKKKGIFAQLRKLQELGEVE